MSNGSSRNRRSDLEGRLPVVYNGRPVEEWYRLCCQQSMRLDRLLSAAKAVVELEFHRANADGGEPYDPIANPGQFDFRVVDLAKAIESSGDCDLLSVLQKHREFYLSKYREKLDETAFLQFLALDSAIEAVQREVLNDRQATPPCAMQPLPNDSEPITTEWLQSIGFKQNKRCHVHGSPYKNWWSDKHKLEILEFNGTGVYLWVEHDSVDMKKRRDLRLLIEWAGDRT